MRFSTFALFIALPAAAYAAVCPQQFSVLQNDECAKAGEYCDKSLPCCGAGLCLWNGHSGVCPSAYALLLADQNVRYASKTLGPTLSVLVWMRGDV
ncbi:hypothetical protein BJY52DRAFT_1328382 [Lactarius psammicola]|nr:hypothetical protein BJY52DRAFT_1328382 [Lactarius psammicola]